MRNNDVFARTKEREMKRNKEYKEEDEECHENMYVVSAECDCKMQK